LVILAFRWFRDLVTFHFFVVLRAPSIRKTGTAVSFPPFFPPSRFKKNIVIAQSQPSSSDCLILTSVILDLLGFYRHFKTSGNLFFFSSF